MTKSKRYTLRDKPSAHVREKLGSYPEFVQDLLAARGITTQREAGAFFNPDYDTQTHDPFLLKDMPVAVERILTAIDVGEHIAVYSDFDADGIPGGALLHDVFKKIGYERFTNYIPHRDTEGYGFHKDAVDVLAAKGVTLIITVDVGIANADTAAYARSVGVDVIITDHHIPPEKLPDAVAVVNPQRTDETYPYRYLCGTGVAFKLAQALLSKARETKQPWVADVSEGWEKWLLDLVALATIGDMVPVTGENRVFVHYGLLVLRKSKRPGISALCRTLRMSQQHLSEDDIGFSIAPRINAASRMGSPETGFTLLTTTEDAVATYTAKELDTLNNQRKGHVASIVKDLKTRFEEPTDDAVLVAGNPKWNPALLGLAANTLVETYGKTACLWGREGTGSIKGSCRGAGEVNIVAMFNEAQSALSQFGGHAHAGGFAVIHEQLHTLSDTFNAAHSVVAQSDEIEPLYVDAELTHASLHETYRALTAFAPFGMENAKPTFICKSMTVQKFRQFGKEDAHIEVHIADDAFRTGIRAIAFFKNPDSFTTQVEVHKIVDVVCTLELSRFAGRTQLELRIVDIM